LAYVHLRARSVGSAVRAGSLWSWRRLMADLGFGLTLVG
jgi:hypothetical protein